MMKVSALTLMATLCAGAASALPTGFFFDTGPVIDFDSGTEVIDVLPFVSGITDLAFSAPVSAFSFDAGFNGAPEVDFAGTVDTLGSTTILDVPFLSVEDTGTVLLESFNILDVTFGSDTLEVLFSDLGGTRAGDFGGFALFTLTTIDVPTTPKPWELATSAESYTFVGTIESVAPVPLPAGIWMLLTGLGAVGALRAARHRRPG